MPPIVEGSGVSTKIQCIVLGNESVSTFDWKLGGYSNPETSNTKIVSSGIERSFDGYLHECRAVLSNGVKSDFVSAPMNVLCKYM